MRTAGGVAELEAVLKGATATPAASSDSAPCQRSARKPSESEYSDSLLALEQALTDGTR